MKHERKVGAEVPSLGDEVLPMGNIKILGQKNVLRFRLCRRQKSPRKSNEFF
jgi:hypothetical protein